jgi:hypothetical protein
MRLPRDDRRSRRRERGHGVRLKPTVRAPRTSSASSPGRVGQRCGAAGSRLWNRSRPDSLGGKRDAKVRQIAAGVCGKGSEGWPDASHGCVHVANGRHCLAVDSTQPKTLARGGEGK